MNQSNTSTQLFELLNKVGDLLITQQRMKQEVNYLSRMNHECN